MAPIQNAIDDLVAAAALVGDTEHWLIFPDEEAAGSAALVTARVTLNAAIQAALADARREGEANLRMDATWALDEGRECPVCGGPT